MIVTKGLSGLGINAQVTGGSEHNVRDQPRRSRKYPDKNPATESVTAS